jgi:hypothetical protein
LGYGNKEKASKTCGFEPSLFKEVKSKSFVGFMIAAMVQTKQEHHHHSNITSKRHFAVENVTVAGRSPFGLKLGGKHMVPLMSLPGYLLFVLYVREAALLIGYANKKALKLLIGNYLY